MDQDYFKVKQETKEDEEEHSSQKAKNSLKSEKFATSSFLSLKKIAILIIVIVVFVALGLGGYYLYKKGYLKIGADVSDQKDLEKGYSEDINLLPAPQ